VKRLRLLDQILSLFLSSHQKVMLKFSKHNLISVSDDAGSSSEDDLDQNIKMIPG
jgi:hypothetical protein